MLGYFLKTSIIAWAIIVGLLLCVFLALGGVDAALSLALGAAVAGLMETLLVLSALSYTKAGLQRARGATKHYGRIGRGVFFGVRILIAAAIIWITASKWYHIDMPAFVTGLSAQLPAFAIGGVACAVCENRRNLQR